MAVTPFDSALWRELYGDAELQALFTDSAEIRAMLLVEAALARAQARLGVVPETAAAAIGRAAETVMIDPAALAPGAASAGVPVPALVAAFREAIAAPEHARHVHFGATSQDIVDTGLTLRLRRALQIIDTRLEALTATLGEKARAEADTAMAARTRSQIATPTTFGARIAVWRAPLLRARDRLAELRPRLLRISLAGASGTLAAMGASGPQVAALMAEDLRLGHDPVPWHAARDNIAELGGALTLITGALGKIGLDLTLMTRSEAREAAAGAPGGSSTMPQKANPVGPETLVALARANAGLIGRLYEAQLHAEEREGAAWALEWLTLPQIVIAAGAALRHAQALADTLEARPDAMRRTMAATNGLMLAEAATFALAPHVGRPEAEALVKAACRRAAAQERPLAALLAEMSDAPVDWAAALDPGAYLGAAPAIARGD
ncbi:3-carboxy-cis,cis-muconate cycloisomerase [Pikeienuella piscinae]|uniref:3-carboxy-cis,cis-muconate cycloisomerase n=1 Tax=Pikeienuella piscinae TaxID=2748098 RepID=A0A7L5BUZ2_9RHOB|nr:3-carboxy-cis,cis-muconate cycloisomerase [Pikeienuella piscinae]QIE56130.1 3-carboxy-cis,cis-muconate cycloisomerase [Pikeienuella piscinae]